MSIKPILFNTEMVRAILDGRKTQTRRVVVPHYRDGDAGFNVITNAATGKFLYIEYYDENESSTERRLNPPYIPGDVLWVRETWNYGFVESSDREYANDVWFEPSDRKTEGSYIRALSQWWYKADANTEKDMRELNGFWRPSIHMPKEAARIFLKVKDVRCERLQDITNNDAKAEGVICATDNSGMMHRHKFRLLWDSIADEQTNWDANPWVWVYEFERVDHHA